MNVLSAVIPCYATPARLLERAVESAAACVARAGTGGRVIVVDDGSPEPVRLGPEAGGVEVVVIRRDNAGPSAARNAGLDACAGVGGVGGGGGGGGMGWVLLLDADDEAIVDGVERMRALGEKLGAWAVVSPRVQVRADASGGVRERVKAAPAEWADRALPGRGCVFAPLDVFSSTGMLVSGNAIAAGVRFDEGLKIGEDRDFLARCAERGPVGVSSVPGVRYTLHGDGGTNLTSATHMRRRIADHIVLLDRWCDADSRAHMRALTAWLINAASKAGVDGASWDALVSAAGRHGLGVPLKARLRRLVATRSGA